MFNEAGGVSNFICDSRGLALTRQKQLCHSLIRSDLFPSLNSSWSSGLIYFLQALLTSFPPLCSSSSCSYVYFVPLRFSVDWSSVLLFSYSSSFLAEMHRRDVFLLSASLPPHFLCGLFWLARSLLPQAPPCHLDEFESLFPTGSFLHCASQIIMSFSIYSFRRVR